MSIRSELNNTKHYLRESRKAILGRGGEISEKAGLKDIPEAVWSIPADASLAFREDSDVAYEKVVPSGAEEYALVKSLGGMSYKALGNNNLCSGDKVYTYNNEPNIQSINLGFYEAGTYYFDFDYKELQGVGEYDLDGYGTFGTGALPITFEIQEPLELYLTIETEYNMTGGEAPPMNGNLKNFMLCKADDADKTYKPYSPILVSAKPTSLESRGKNLAQKQYGIISSGASVSSTMIITDKTGKACTSLIPVIGGKKYTLSKTYTDAKSDFRWFFFDREPILSETKSIGGAYQPNYSKYTITIPDNATYLFVRWTSNEETNPCGDVQIELGDTATEYKPYSAEPIDTKALPEAVQALDGWGLGIDAEYNNHIEWRNGRVYYVQKVSTKAFNGTENYWINSHLNNNGTKAYQTAFTSLSGVAPLCSHFKGMTWVGSRETYTVQNVSGSGLVFITDGVQTLDEFKAYLAEQYNSGNPVTVVYALAEPIETDITHLFTSISPFIKVQGGGGVIAHNERKEAVPSTLKYTIKVGS